MGASLELWCSRGKQIPHDKTARNDKICEAVRNDKTLFIGARLLQAVSFLHHSLYAGFVEKVVGQFFVGEHG
jgi:hypothetical protein